MEIRHQNNGKSSHSNKERLERKRPRSPSSSGEKSHKVTYGDIYSNRVSTGQSKRLFLEGNAETLGRLPSRSTSSQQPHSLPKDELLTVKFLLSCVFKHLEDRTAKRRKAILQWEKDGA